MAKSRPFRGGDLKKVTGMFGSFQVFCVVGIERKIEKIPKIPVIFALPRFVGSERNFLENIAPELAKNMFSPSRGIAGRNGRFYRFIHKPQSWHISLLRHWYSRGQPERPAGGVVVNGESRKPPLPRPASRRSAWTALRRRRCTTRS